MTLQNYKVTNNGESTLEAGISAGIGTLILATGTRARFPSTFPFFLTLEQFNASLQVTKREIVKVTAGATETLTITRSAGYCPVDYQAQTYTNTAQSFLAGDSVKLKLVAEIIDDLNAELVRIVATEIPALLPKAGGYLTGLLGEAQGADIASATTTNLATATGNSLKITGTTTITGFGTVTAGVVMKLTFTGILTLTHNATSLILPNAGSNITTAAGDSMIITSLWSGNWKCLNYTRANGTALVASTPGAASESDAGIAELATLVESMTGTDSSRILTPDKVKIARLPNTLMVANSLYQNFHIMPASGATTNVITNGWNESNAVIAADQGGGGIMFFDTTGSADGQIYASIPGKGTQGYFRYADIGSNPLFFKTRVLFGTSPSATETSSWGTGELTSAYNATGWSIRICIDDNTGDKLYAVTADGTTNTNTNITGALTLTAWLWVGLEITSTSVKFYVGNDDNMTLVATHTTNIPTVANPIQMGWGVVDNGSQPDMYITPIQCSIPTV